MVDAALDGARSDGLEALDVIDIPALEVVSADVLGADGYLLATPANLGSMSGALKHAFDTTYLDALDVTNGRPFGVLVHGESDTTGAERAIAGRFGGIWRAFRAAGSMPPLPVVPVPVPLPVPEPVPVFRGVGRDVDVAPVSWTPQPER